jgi:hypothetical protein
MMKQRLAPMLARLVPDLRATQGADIVTDLQKMRKINVLLSMGVTGVS